jgi:hypothetical protein
MMGPSHQQQPQQLRPGHQQQPTSNISNSQQQHEQLLQTMTRSTEQQSAGPRRRNGVHKEAD